MDRLIMHIDVNSAYLSWEAVKALEDGSKVDYREVPSIVGGDPKKRTGIVLAKSIPAKKYGIITGEPLRQALDKCPSLLVISPSYGLYTRCSDAMMGVVSNYSDNIERYSVDEVFVDLSHTIGQVDPEELGHRIKDHVKTYLGFTVNVGISHNKLLAKMASDLKKPDNVHTLFQDQIQEKMWPLPIEDLFMVGRATGPKLRMLGINTIGDLANFDEKYIRSRFKKHGIVIQNYAKGIEDSSVATSRPRAKGIGNSKTIPYDIMIREEAHLHILSLTESVCSRLRAAGEQSRLISISIKYSDFSYISHQRKIQKSLDVTGEIYRIARELFDEIWTGNPIRHLGVRLSDFSDSKQISLFDDPRISRLMLVDRAVDKIRDRYGVEAIKRMSFVGTRVRAMSGGVSDSPYPMMKGSL